MVRLRQDFGADTFVLGMIGKAFLLLFLALSFPFFGSAGERYALKIAEGTSPRGGQELVVENALVRYRFWADNGVLASSYLYFAPYGTKELEAVPGWTQDKAPELIQDVSLPLEIWPQGAAPDEPFVYRISYTEQGEKVLEVRLAWQGERLEVEKRFTVAEDALYTLPVEIHLRGQGQGVKLVLGHYPQGKGVPELVYLYEGRKHSQPLASGTLEGIGLVAKDSVFFWKFQGMEGLRPFQGRNGAGQPVFGVEIPAFSGEFVLKGTLYAGRNRYILLEKAGLQGIVELGFFSRFLVGVIRFLETLYRATGNYGWAIVLFTLVAQLFLFPLPRTQIRSMAKMQRLQPKIQRLQRLYKDDKEAFQKHVMELYRQEKVNPLGGCFPILLQFPFLILLWQSIFNSAELFHLSPPFLWIPDLSLPDPYYIIIVLAVAVQLLGQWITTRRSGAQAAGGTQLIGWIFPLFFAFMFRSFPAGLWLYWFLYSSIQNLLQGIVYWELSRAAPKPEDAGKN